MGLTTPTALVCAAVYGLSLLWPQQGWGQDTALPAESRWWHRFRPDSMANWKFGLVPIPAVAFSPETGWRFGVTTAYFFQLGSSKKGSLSKDGFAVAEAEMTSSGQVFIDLNAQFFTSRNRYFVRGGLGYARMKERLWGFGNQTVAYEDYETIRYERKFLNGLVGRQVIPALYAGLRTNLSLTQNVEVLSGPIRILGNRLGHERSFVAGLGPVFIYDKRDHPMAARFGTYAELGFTSFHPGFGSEFRYNEWVIDLRKYYTWQKHTLALQTFAQLTSGQLPWRELPRMGSPTIMRGYFNGRFRAEHYAALQAEYRWMLTKLIGVASFASLGQVQPAGGRWSLQQFKWAAGAGLRIVASQKQRLTLRLDLGVTQEGKTGFYVEIGEAF